MDEPQESHELTDAARRGLQRAGVHLMKAAIEVVAGLSAFLEEINAGGSDRPDSDGGPEHIEVE
ncbi:MAG: hypothetical protein AAB198_07330 [Actinomycetota bacterium]